MNGIINICKERGYTSHDVVAKLRGILRQKKIGHTGTLDPEAKGVLPVCLGTATKLCDMLTDWDKEYVAVLRLGVETDTQDVTGTVLKEHPVEADRDRIASALGSFLGEYYQIPPMYSALKVNGQKLYDLARKGITVERQPRKVMIKELHIEQFHEESHKVKFRVVCSKGTYIRTLCHDAGQVLGCGGCMESLVRTRVGCFSLENAVSLEEIQNRVKSGGLETVIYPPDAMFSYKKLYLSQKYDRLVHNGNSFVLEDGELSEKDMRVLVYDSEKQFVGVYACRQGIYKPIKMFLGG